MVGRMLFKYKTRLPWPINNLVLVVTEPGVDKTPGKVNYAKLNQAMRLIHLSQKLDLIRYNFRC